MILVGHHLEDLLHTEGVDHEIVTDSMGREVLRLTGTPFTFGLLWLDIEDGWSLDSEDITIFENDLFYGMLFPESVEELVDDILKLLGLTNA